MNLEAVWEVKTFIMNHWRILSMACHSHICRLEGHSSCCAEKGGRGREPFRREFRVQVRNDHVPNQESSRGLLIAWCGPLESYLGGTLGSVRWCICKRRICLPGSFILKRSPLAGIAAWLLGYKVACQPYPGACNCNSGLIPGQTL